MSVACINQTTGQIVSWDIEIIKNLKKNYLRHLSSFRQFSVSSLTETFSNDAVESNVGAMTDNNLMFKSNREYFDFLHIRYLTK